MTPATIIKQATADGVNLVLSDTGKIKVTGDQVAVNRWVALLQEHKASIIEALKIGAGDTASIPRPADERIGKMVDKLKGDPGLRYAMQDHDQIEPDAVILTLAIWGKGACELRIPKSRYDGIVLLKLVEKHTTRETLQ